MISETSVCLQDKGYPWSLVPGPLLGCTRVRPVVGGKGYSWPAPRGCPRQDRVPHGQDRGTTKQDRLHCGRYIPNGGTQEDFLVLSESPTFRTQLWIERNTCRNKLLMKLLIKLILNVINLKTYCTDRHADS